MRQEEDEQKRFSSPGFSSLPGSRVPMFGSRVYVVGEREVSIALGLAVRVSVVVG